MKSVEKEHWRLLLDPSPITEGKWQPHQQDLVWVGPYVWRLVPTTAKPGVK